MNVQLNLYSKYKYIWEQLDNTMDSIFSYIQNYPLIQMDSYGNIVVSNTKEDADKVPVFCCHMDTVHTEEPQLELVHDVLMSVGGGGVGGDDKCGIIACLELLKLVPCKCIFFRDEETGCRGSNKFNANTLKDNMFCIEIDRRGEGDLIFSACRGQMCSEEFQDRVKKFFPHGKAAVGSLTDVCVLGKAGINMMNLSAGYYRPHSDKEYVVLTHLQRNIDCLAELAKDIIKNPLKEKGYKRSELAYENKRYFTEMGSGSEQSSSTGYGRYGTRNQDLFHKQGYLAGYDADSGEEDYEALQYGKK